MAINFINIFDALTISLGLCFKFQNLELTLRFHHSFWVWGRRRRPFPPGVLFFGSPCQLDAIRVILAAVAEIDVSVHQCFSPSSGCTYIFWLYG